jgi:membrane protease YdiL (CAAX protease family)
MLTEPSPRPLPPETAPPSPITHVPRWRWWIQLVLIGGYIVPRIALTAAFPRHSPALSDRVSTLLLVCAVEVLFFGLMYLIAIRTSGATKEELFLPWRPGWLVLPLGIVYSIGIRLAAGAVIFAVLVVLIGSRVVEPTAAHDYIRSEQPHVQQLVDVSAMQHNPAYFWLIVTVVSFVVAGLREEMWRSGTLAAMRALWPRAFSSIRGQMVAVALIAVLFGAAHLQLGVLGAILAGLLGLFLGVIIIVHRSIWPAVIAHGLLDATTFALIPFILTKSPH